MLRSRFRSLFFTLFSNSEIRSIISTTWRTCLEGFESSWTQFWSICVINSLISLCMRAMQLLKLAFCWGIYFVTNIYSFSSPRNRSSSRSDIPDPRKHFFGLAFFNHFSADLQNAEILIFAINVVKAQLASKKAINEHARHGHRGKFSMDCQNLNHVLKPQ